MDSFADILRKYFFLDLSNSYHAIPSSLLLILIAILIISTIAFLLLYNIRKAYVYSARLILVEYLILFVSSTIIFRDAHQTSSFDATPFGSYKAIFSGDIGLIVDNIMNVIAFIPIGFLLCFSARGIKWWQVALFACICSLMIEFTQFLLSRGFSEIDDVFHNTLGAILGYGLCLVCSIIYRSLFQKNKAINGPCCNLLISESNTRKNNNKL